jgi:type I restriction enzyme M protein
MSLSNFVKRIRNIMRNDAGINGDAQRIEQIAWMLFLKVYDEKEKDWEFNEDDYQSIIPESCRWSTWAHDDGNGDALTGDKLLDFVNNILFPTLKNIEITPQTPIRKAVVRTTFDDANQYMKDGVLLRQVVNVIDELNLGDYEESHAFGDIYESILKEMQSAGSSGEFYTPRALTDFMAYIIQPQIGEKMADFACGTGGFITSWLKELDKRVTTADDREELNTSIYGIEKKQFPYMLCVTNMLLHGIDTPSIYHSNSLTKDVLNFTDDDKFDVILMNPPYGGNEKSDVKSHFPSDMRSSETADLFIVLIMYRLKENGRAAVIIPDGFLFGVDGAKLAIKTQLLRQFNLHTIIRLPGSIFAPYTPIATNILFFDNKCADGAPEGFYTKKTWFYRLDMPEGYKHFSKTKPMRIEHCQPIIDWWNDRKEIINGDGDEKSRCFTVEELIAGDCNFDLCKFPKDEEEILPPAELLANYYKKRAALDHEIDKTLAEIQRILGIDLPKE